MVSFYLLLISVRSRPLCFSHSSFHHVLTEICAATHSFSKHVTSVAKPTSLCLYLFFLFIFCLTPTCCLSFRLTSTGPVSVDWGYTRHTRMCGHPKPKPTLITLLKCSCLTMLVLVSGVQQSDSVIHIHISILLQILHTIK